MGDTYLYLSFLRPEECYGWDSSGLASRHLKLECAVSFWQGDALLALHRRSWPSSHLRGGLVIWSFSPNLIASSEMPAMTSLPTATGEDFSCGSSDFEPGRRAASPDVVQYALEMSGGAPEAIS